MEKLPPKLENKLRERLAQDAFRRLPSYTDRIDFSSNDYLGLAQSDDIASLTLELLHSTNNANGATGSRLLSGNHNGYKELESFLAVHHRAEAALVFNSGYDANVGFFSAVPQRGDIVLYDELIHASIRDGIQMGHAKSYKFAHNDLGDLKRRVESLQAQSAEDADIYIVTESVFSMDGDTPDLSAMVKLCEDHSCYLIIDEAHATGIFGGGRDMVCALGLEEKVFARLITFGKAMGCHGASILGSEALKDYLVNFARSLIYTTALSRHSVAAIRAAYQVLGQMGPIVNKQLFENIGFFKEECKKLGISDPFVASNSAIQCVVVSGNGKVKQISAHLQEKGFEVKPILSPTVKEGSERLRFCLHSFNTTEEISRVLLLLKKELQP